MARKSRIKGGCGQDCPARLPAPRSMHNQVADQSKWPWPILAAGSPSILSMQANESKALRHGEATGKSARSLVSGEAAFLLADTTPAVRVVLNRRLKLLGSWCRYQETPIGAARNLPQDFRLFVETVPPLLLALHFADLFAPDPRRVRGQQSEHQPRRRAAVPVH